MWDVIISSHTFRNIQSCPHQWRSILTRLLRQGRLYQCLESQPCTESHSSTTFDMMDFPLAWTLDVLQAPASTIIPPSWQRYYHLFISVVSVVTLEGLGPLPHFSTMLMFLHLFSPLNRPLWRTTSFCKLTMPLNLPPLQAELEHRLFVCSPQEIHRLCSFKGSEGPDCRRLAHDWGGASVGGYVFPILQRWDLFFNLFLVPITLPFKYQLGQQDSRIRCEVIRFRFSNRISRAMAIDSNGALNILLLSLNGNIKYVWFFPLCGMLDENILVIYSLVECV